MADPPPKATHSRFFPVTLATPWQEFSLTLYDQQLCTWYFPFTRKGDLKSREINLMGGPFEFGWGTKVFINCSMPIREKSHIRKEQLSKTMVPYTNSNRPPIKLISSGLRSPFLAK